MERYACTFSFHATGVDYYKRRVSHCLVIVEDGASEAEISAAFEKRFEELFPSRWDPFFKCMNHTDPLHPELWIYLDEVDWVPAVEHPTTAQRVAYYDKLLRLR